jgi:hypothetical protein
MKVLHIIAMAIMNIIMGLAFPIGFLILLNLHSDNRMEVLKAMFWVLVAFVVWFVLIYLYNRNIKKGKYTVGDAALINMAVRIVLIPVYIVVFIICVIACITGPFAVGIWAFAFITDSFILLMTNLMSIPCCKAIRKSHLLGKGAGMSVLLFLYQFMFCIDVIVAITYFVTAKSAEGKRIN